MTKVVQHSCVQYWIPVRRRTLEHLVDQLLVEEVVALDLSRAEVRSFLNSPLRAATREVVVRTLEQVWELERKGIGLGR